MKDILIIDDETDISNIISDFLKEKGIKSTMATNSSQALEAISNNPPKAIILDVLLEGSELDGLGILEIVKKQYPLMPVIVISGHGTVETAVRAIKMGAYDYLEKPFSHEKLMIVLQRAYEASKLRKENIVLKSKVINKTELIGNTTILNKIKGEIEKIAPTSGRVMIHGSVGTGKELIARLIHKKSTRSNFPFVIFSPTAVSTNKLQQELFCESEVDDDHNNKRVSAFETAHNGTLYIDEVGDLPRYAQNKLLAFLKDQTIMRNNKVINLNIRLITSTTKNLLSEVDKGNFRKDLYYRLNVIPLTIPTLLERKDDIPLLVEYFVEQLSKFSGLIKRKFSNETIAALQSYHWPGNIRQLRNIIEWTLIMNSSTNDTKDIIRTDMLPQEILNNSVNISKPDNNVDMMSMSLREAREEFEKQYLTAQMSRFNNNISKTSTFIGMERSALHRKLKTLSIHGASNKAVEAC